MLRLLITALTLALAMVSAHADVAFLAAPRTTGFFRTQSLSENHGPYVHHPEAQLVIRKDDGAETVAIPSGVQDVRRSSDGKSLLVTLVLNYVARGPDLMPGGQSDLYRYTLATGTLTRITNTPDVWECQPVETPDGKICFLSNEDNWQNPHEAYRALTIYSMCEDGTERKRIWHAGLGGVFGLALGGDGWLYFASGENQGFRGGRGNHWPIWKCRPDGSGFEPVFTVLGVGNVCDWPCQISNGGVICSRYYDTRIYGTLYGIPKFTWEAHGPQSKWGDPLWINNPAIAAGFEWMRFPWQPLGLYALTRDGIEGDWENSSTQTSSARPALPAGSPVVQYGMFSHPVPIPGNGIYYTWTGDNGDAAMDLGIGVCADASTQFRNTEIVMLVDEPDRHEWMATPICGDTDVYGAPIPNITANLDVRLAPGSPLSFIGSTSVDFGEFSDLASSFELKTPKLIQPPPESIHYIRVLGMQPTLNVKIAGMPGFWNGSVDNPWGNWEGFSSEINERVGILGDVPVSKWGETADGPVLHTGPNPPPGLVRTLRSDGNLDTSFGAFIPADMAWSLQGLNEKKEAIYGMTAQSWHQTISAEWRPDCAGCHNHNKPDQFEFDKTWAGRPGATPAELLKLNFTTKDDLPASIPSRPWPYGQGPASSGSTVRTYNSSGADLDDNPDFSEDEKLAVRRWIDTGMLEGPGAKTDTMEPTLVVEGRYVGALDPHTGLKSLTIDGVDVTALIDATTHIYSHPKPWPTDHAIEFIATDNAGLTTTFSKRFDGTPEPEPEPPTPIAAFVGFEDVMGPLRSRIPDGKPDYHFRLTDMPLRAIDHLDIKAGSDSGGTGFKWSNLAGEESPAEPEGRWWYVKYSPPLNVPSATRDIWFSNPKPDAPYTAFRIYALYSNASDDDRTFLPATAPLVPQPELEPKP